MTVKRYFYAHVKTVTITKRVLFGSTVWYVELFSVSNVNVGAIICDTKAKAYNVLEGFFNHDYKLD